ncbi:hypothetical protein MP638_003722 [Amoeboaphelidium occidentale]|nr:hypothetical protein MP638_003722 [Amoeboaphelidium occidentale]
MVKVVQSSKEFKEIIASGKVVVVDFYAEWCGPCKFIAPKIEAFSQTYTSAVFLKVDVDVLADLAGEYGIQAMPTFQIFKNGQKISEVVGADANKLEAAIKKATA